MLSYSAALTFGMLFSPVIKAKINYFDLTELCKRSRNRNTANRSNIISLQNRYVFHSELLSTLALADAAEAYTVDIYVLVTTVNNIVFYFVINELIK